MDVREWFSRRASADLSIFFPSPFALSHWERAKGEGELAPSRDGEPSSSSAFETYRKIHFAPGEMNFAVRSRLMRCHSLEPDCAVPTPFKVLRNCPARRDYTAFSTIPTSNEFCANRKASHHRLAFSGLLLISTTRVLAGYKLLGVRLRYIQFLWLLYPESALHTR